MLCNESTNFNLSVSLATQMLRIKMGKKSGNHNSIFYRDNRGSWIHIISEYCLLTWCQNRQELKERFSGRKWLSQNGSPEICGRSDSQPKTPGRISHSLIHSAQADSYLLSTHWLLWALCHPTGRHRVGASLSQRAHPTQTPTHQNYTLKA